MKLVDAIRVRSQAWWEQACSELARRSQRLGRGLELRMERFITGWIMLVVLAAVLKVLSAPNRAGSVVIALCMSLPFLALAAAPVIGYRLAVAAFPRKLDFGPPSFRLSRFGRWRTAAGREVEQASVAGPAGFLVSLIIGLLLNVPMRSLEFLAVVPAINPGDPAWAHVLVVAMTCDVVLMNFAYMVCFVMALRGNPLFPRLLVMVWVLDIVLQLGIARVIGLTDFPVSLVDPLVGFLDGNIKKVLVSAVLWLPYLIVSKQVNLIFRHRVRLPA